MSDDRAQREWEALWADIDRRYREAKDSQGALVALFECYRGLNPADRKSVDALLGGKLHYSDEDTRFDALALISEFKIKTAIPDLQQLQERLAGQSFPGAPFERAKVLRILEQLGAGSA